MSTSLAVAIDALRRIRDMKAPERTDYPEAWYEGYAREAANGALHTLQRLGAPELTALAVRPLGEPNF